MLSIESRGAKNKMALSRTSNEVFSGKLAVPIHIKRPRKVTLQIWFAFRSIEHVVRAHMNENRTQVICGKGNIAGTHSIDRESVHGILFAFLNMMKCRSIDDDFWS